MELYYVEPASRVMTHLLDVYNKLQPAGGFEIVFVAITCDTDDIYSDYTKHQFSQMPWPAIPLSDFKSREHLQTIFGVSSPQNPSSPPSFIIDPRGVVLQSRSSHLFARYGAAGFPFTRERIEFLDSEDNVARMQPVSIQKLLASPQRDYLIDNDGDEVYNVILTSFLSLYSGALFAVLSFHLHFLIYSCYFIGRYLFIILMVRWLAYTFVHVYINHTPPRNLCKFMKSC